MSKGYLIVPLSNKTKIPAVEDFKHYTSERATNLINLNFFTDKDIAIVLDRNHCCIDIDDDGLTSSQTIYEKLCQKIKGFSKYPTEKTKHGYHIYFSCNDDKLKRNIKFLNSEFLCIIFNKEKFETMNDEDKKKVKYMNGKYTLPVDFLIGYHNGTNAYARTAPSTNIKTINELPFITELPQFPENLKNQLELVTDKVLNIIKNVKKGNYIPPQYTDEN